MGGKPAVTCEHVSKSFGATKAVSDVSFAIMPGEVLALVGENGAGKSTLMNMLADSLAPDSGTIRIAPRLGLARSVAMVHQELSLFANLTVAENLELDAREGRRRALVSEARSRAVARRVIAELGADIPIDAAVGTLSVGQQQLVEVAKAIAVAPALLILDEPTSSLEGPQVDLLFAAVQRVKEQGTAVIFVSHRMEELFRFCDTALVLRDGKRVEAGPLSSYTRERLVAAMVGRETETFYPPRAHASTVASPPAIALEHISTGGIVADVSIDFPAGRVSAIAGLDGHGQSEIAEIVAGARRPTAGRLRVAGEPVRFRSPRQAIAHGIGYIPPNRRLDGLMIDKSVASNVTLAAGHRLHPSGLYSGRTEKSTVSSVISRLAIKCSSLFQPVGELSGGNQQKALVGRWLVYRGLKALVLNDPTRGVDVGSRAQIYAVIRRLAEDGVAVVLVSTDMQEILGLSDQIYVMYSGAVTGRLDTETATESDVMHLAVGGPHHA